MNSIIQLGLVLVIFFVIKWFAWQITDEWGLPEWLQYKPWNCNLCLTFWSLMAVYLIAGLVAHQYITMFVGIGLAILNAIAMWINQRKKTIKIIG